MNTTPVMANGTQLHHEGQPVFSMQIEGKTVMVIEAHASLIQIPPVIPQVPKRRMLRKYDIINYGFVDVMYLGPDREV